MGTKIVLELEGKTKTEPQIWSGIKETIENAGGSHITEPPENPPYIITAIMPDKNSAQKILRRIRSLRGVRQADIDQMRFTL